MNHPTPADVTPAQPPRIEAAVQRLREADPDLDADLAELTDLHRTLARTLDQAEA